MADGATPDAMRGRVVRSPLRVRFAETDAQGVVYYGNYFVYFEVGRVDLLREARGASPEGRLAPAGAAVPTAGESMAATAARAGSSGNGAGAERGGGIGALVVAHAECDYRAPARFDDRLEVQTWIEALGRTSITFGHRVVRLPEAEELARGRVVAVHLGPTGRPAPLPDDWRRALERYRLVEGAPVAD
ncbi:thioesterase family protein [Thermaerobacter sp. FW80]|uniref:acyl-CoA thioesterase n=1 Tax=Thermaerobacter sp. FW80 TaxID=2546351 RepID=UPI001FA9C906|nr:thioesterase family protein [Thermaerobacter sp. FW80]